MLAVEGGQSAMGQDCQYLCTRREHLIVAGRAGVVSEVTPIEVSSDLDEPGEVFIAQVFMTASFLNVNMIRVVVAASVDISAKELIKRQVRVLAGKFSAGPLPLLQYLRRHMLANLAAWSCRLLDDAGESRRAAARAAVSGHLMFLLGPLEAATLLKPTPGHGNSEIEDDEVVVDLDEDGDFEGQVRSGVRYENPDDSHGWPSLGQSHQKPVKSQMDDCTKLSVYIGAKESRRSQMAIERRKSEKGYLWKPRRDA